MASLTVYTTYEICNQVSVIPQQNVPKRDLKAKHISDIYKAAVWQC